MDTHPKLLNTPEARGIRFTIISDIDTLVRMISDILEQLKKIEGISVIFKSSSKWVCYYHFRKFIVRLYSSGIDDQYYFIIRDEDNIGICDENNNNIRRRPISTEEWLKFNRCRRYLLNSFIINKILFNNNTQTHITLPIEPIVHTNNDPMGRPPLRRQSVLHN